MSGESGRLRLTLAQALDALEAPGRPTALFVCDSAQLPPAAQHPWRLAAVRDLNILAHSDGSDWIRQDTGAAI